MPAERSTGNSPGENGKIKNQGLQVNSRRRTKISDKKIADDEFMAASIGDVEWLKQSIKDKKDDISYDKNGLTPLHLAAIHGRLDCLKYLIEKLKLDVNLASTTGWRPVHLAISNQTGKRALQCLHYLLDKGADSSLVNEDGITPCHQAASEGHVQCLKLLIEIGAKVDGKDCRGHTPLDLAKLWGHRKCARILSAEVWHQEKDHVAKEMKQLKRLKMQQVLKELEEEEQLRAAQEFYGDIAFKEWLESRNLNKKPVQGSPLGKESLQKPNSIAVKVSQKPGRKAELSCSDGKKVASKDLVHEEQSNDTNNEEPQKGKTRLDISQMPIYTNPSEWVKSTKVPAADYTVNLPDDYPRDAYTMMPVREDAPKFYDGSFWKRLETPEHEAEKLKSQKLRNPDLPKETVQRVLSRDHTRQQRPFIFRPIHIYDVNIKKKYPTDKKPRSEASLHMCNDVSSYLFQKSLQRSNLRSRSVSSVSSKSTGSNKTEDSDWMKPGTLRSEMSNTIRNMSGPSHFPPIKGEEFSLYLVK